MAPRGVKLAKGITIVVHDPPELLQVKLHREDVETIVAAVVKELPLALREHFAEVADRTLTPLRKEIAREFQEEVTAIEQRLLAKMTKRLRDK